MWILPNQRITLLRRGFALGYRAGYRKARVDLHKIVDNFDAELARLEDQFSAVGEMAAELRHDRAIQQAIDERLGIPNEWLH